MSYQFQKVKVLIVDDNQAMRQVTSMLLETFGIGKVLEAEEGETGFKIFQEENPDIVILDWIMEPIDGIALTKRIRTDSGSQNQFVPIIMMTGFSEKRHVTTARDAGVTEYVVKPFSAHDLYRRIVQLIERPRQFIRTETYFGPDRRRKIDDAYAGPLRRVSDKTSENEYNQVGNRSRND